jgi:hypothetical protein
MKWQLKFAYADDCSSCVHQLRRFIPVSASLDGQSATSVGSSQSETVGASQFPFSQVIQRIFF